MSGTDSGSSTGLVLDPGVLLASPILLEPSMHNVENEYTQEFTKVITNDDKHYFTDIL